MSFSPALAVLTTTIRRKSGDVYEPMYIYPQTTKIRPRPNHPTARQFLSIRVRHVSDRREVILVFCGCGISRHEGDDADDLSP